MAMSSAYDEAATREEVLHFFLTHGVGLRYSGHGFRDLSFVSECKQHALQFIEVCSQLVLVVSVGSATSCSGSTSLVFPVHLSPVVHKVPGAVRRWSTY